MSKGRLTRQELSWLLTQEAQNAAERLRVGVQGLRTQAPPPPDAPEPSAPGEGAAHDPAGHVVASLDALDDVMKMLSSLNQRASTGAAAPPRRGRTDLAALLCEVAPEARVSIEPGSGTEVYGDEADFRRMVQVLVGHAAGDGSSVHVRRDGDEVRVSVALGPDSSPTAETERAWLSRMALRYGGRHELEGGNELLVLPAEGVADRSEREALQRELDEARAQGEVYARELAAVFERGEEVTTVSTLPPAPSPRDGEAFATVAKLCGGVAAELRATLGPLSRELAALRPPPGGARTELNDEQLDGLRRRVTHLSELASGLAVVSEVSPSELASELDLAEAARAAAREAQSLAERAGVAITAPPAEGRGPRAHVRTGVKALAALARGLVAHAVSASPRGSRVEVSASSDALGARLVVDDAGSALPASSRRSFLSLESHGGAYGRPSGLALFLAAELASAQGAMLELSDSPLGGLRVTVTFASTP